MQSRHLVLVLVQSTARVDAPTGSERHLLQVTGYVANYSLDSAYLENVNKNNWLSPSLPTHKHVLL